MLPSARPGHTRLARAPVRLILSALPHRVTTVSEQSALGEPAVLLAPDSAAIRDELQRLVLADLLGPLNGEEEEFREEPTDRYILGRLAPGRHRARPGRTGPTRQLSRD